MRVMETSDMVRTSSGVIHHEACPYIARSRALPWVWARQRAAQEVMVGILNNRLRWCKHCIGKDLLPQNVQDTAEDVTEYEGVAEADVTWFEICAHCGSIEKYSENDPVDETDYHEGLWPCATSRILDGGGENG